MSKRSTKPKYVPKAVDADGDGLVQEGTEFERQVDTELAEEFIEALETVLEVAELPLETYIVQEGENIQSIAEKFKPEGMTRQDYAKYLFKVNGYPHAGKEIKL